MKKSRIISCVLLVALLVSLINIGFTFRDAYFDNIAVLPKGNFLYSSMSPDGETTVSVYKVDVPTGTAIRGAVVTINENGDKNERNIFWQLGQDTAIVGWVSNNTVSINEQLINISTKQVYDSRYDRT